MIKSVLDLTKEDKIISCRFKSPSIKIEMEDNQRTTMYAGPTYLNDIMPINSGIFFWSEIKDGAIKMSVYNPEILSKICKGCRIDFLVEIEDKPEEV